MEIIWWILILILAIVLGFIIGIAGANLFKWILNRRIVNGAKKVILGEKENKFDLDGKVIEVSRFRLRDENDQEIVIDLKEGLAIIPKELIEDKEKIPKKKIPKNKERKKKIPKNKKNAKKNVKRNNKINKK